MLKRARISLEIALVVALFGFTGILQTTAPAAKLVFCGLLGFSVLSLLFGLFEEVPYVANEETGALPVSLPVTAQPGSTELSSQATG